MDSELYSMPCQSHLLVVTDMGPMTERVVSEGVRVYPSDPQVNEQQSTEGFPPDPPCP